MRKSMFAVVVGVASTAFAISGQPQATAESDPVDIRVLTTQVGAPFNIHVADYGIYFADGGSGMVGKLRPNGRIQTIVAHATGASGVAYKEGRLAYTTTISDPNTFENTASALHIKSRYRHVRANTLAYERRHNPDKVNTYGIHDPTPCQVEALGPQARYTGLEDSHAYSVAAWGNTWLVADAGGNDILVVNKWGHIRTLAVLPAQPTVITAEGAAALGLDPECFEGTTYGFEPVPTDVEVGPNGRIYVSTLPGGPEGPGFGARGAVYRVNPWTGKATLVAKGFAGATNVAVGKHGRVFVAELFGGRISMIRGKTISGYVDLPGVVAVEARNGSLWAATLDVNFEGPGSIVKVGHNHAKRMTSVN